MKMEKRITLTAKELKLHEEACAFARQHSESEHGLCRTLREIGESQLYLKFGYSRLFYYAVRELKLSESVASMTITVARKTAMIPELRTVVDEERLSVSKASRIVSSITIENASELIAFAQTHTTNEINEEMARRNPEKPCRDSVRHIGNGLVEVRAQISTSIYEKYQRAQSLLASKGKPTTLEGVLNESLDLFLDRHDPVRKAERAQSRAAKRTEQGVEETQSKPTEHAEAQEVRMHASLSVEDLGAATEFGSEKTKANGANAGAIASTSQNRAQTESDKFRLNRKTSSTIRHSNSSSGEIQGSELPGDLGAKPSSNFLDDIPSSNLPIEAASISKSNSPDELGCKPYNKPSSKRPGKAILDLLAEPGTKPSYKRPGELGAKPSSLQTHNFRHSPRERGYIKAKTNHALMLRTRGRCAFVNDRGERCTEDRYLHRHHIVPLSQGGSDDLENLTLLCSAHHDLVHQLGFAIDGQITWLRSPQVAYLR
jgi:hypothetical protein